MKRIISLLLVLILAVGMLASCGNASLAKRINKAVEKGEPMSYATVKAKLPSDAFWYGFDTPVGNENGVFCVAEGVNSQESFDKMIANIVAGESYRGIIVRIMNGKAIGAVGGKLDKAAYEDLKSK